MLKILFIGDINGRIGRLAAAKLLPKLKKEHKPDLVIANVENAAHGTGVTVPVLKELMEAGIDHFTTGDHAFDKGKLAEECFGGRFPIVRPANFPPDNPGVGYTVMAAGKHNILLINLIGRVFMHKDFDCPFRTVKNILANFAKQNLSAIIVDIHAEATSEKVALRHYLDGQVSALLGTHTHIPTADHAVTKLGTAYLSDVGMCGYADGILGVDKTNIIKTFLTQVKYTHELPETGNAGLDAALISIDPKTAKALAIAPIRKTIKIK